MRNLVHFSKRKAGHQNSPWIAVAGLGAAAAFAAPLISDLGTMRDACFGASHEVAAGAIQAKVKLSDKPAEAFDLPSIGGKCTRRPPCAP